MGNVIIGATMSLDWFMNDRNGDVSRLYPDFEVLRSTEMLQEEIRTTGAVVMGRHAYDMAEGDLTGYEYQVPIFVLTHTVPQHVIKGENDRLRVTFVMDGIESAIGKGAGDSHGSKNNRGDGHGDEQLRQGPAGLARPVGFATENHGERAESLTARKRSSACRPGRHKSASTAYGASCSRPSPALR